MKQIEINGIKYQIGKMDALTQFHVLRRLTPILATAGIGVAQLKGMKTADDFMPLLAPITAVVASMSDDDSNYIIFACLSAVKRQVTPESWAPLTSPERRLMYQDIDMVMMLRLGFEVLRENMMGFLTEFGAQSSSPNS